jgi:hypothetical protein
MGAACGCFAGKRRPRGARTAQQTDVRSVCAERGAGGAWWREGGRRRVEGRECVGRWGRLWREIRLHGPICALSWFLVQWAKLDATVRFGRILSGVFAVYLVKAISYRWCPRRGVGVDNEAIIGAKRPSTVGVGRAFVFVGAVSDVWNPGRVELGSLSGGMERR